jgi:hypothetical protein
MSHRSLWTCIWELLYFPNSGRQKKEQLTGLYLHYIKALVNEKYTPGLIVKRG